MNGETVSFRGALTMTCSLSLALAAVFCFCCGHAEEIPALTLDDCVKASLANNPKLKEAVSNVDLNKAGVGSAKSAYLPQVSTSGGYTHYDTSKVAFGSFAVSGALANSLPGFDTRYNVASENTGISQLIWDFGKTLNQIKLAKENLTTAQYAFLEAQENTVFNAKSAYYEALKAQSFLEVAKENLSQSQVHLDRAKGFFEVGFRQKYDVTRAEVEVSNAKLETVKAKKDYALSKASLNNIMGRNENTDYMVADLSDYKMEDVNIDDALKVAMKNRVELLRRQSEAQAAQYDLAIKRKGNWPSVSASGEHQVSDTDTPGVGNVRSWNAGVSFNWPWFNGFKTKSEIEAAQAGLKIAQLAIEDQALSVTLEVQDAVLSLGEAKERLNVAEKLLQEATENLDIATARYEEGLGSIIEVTDAETSRISAKQSRAAAISDYLISQARYEKSVGIIAQSVIK